MKNKVIETIKKYKLIEAGDKIIPIVLAHQNFLLSFPIIQNPIIVVINIGKNTSFKCSHVLSLTAENEAIILLSPLHSYKKCKIVPKIHVKITLNI